MNPEIPRDRVNQNGNQDKGVPIDGFAQVLEMLRIADPKFRESLLQRLAQKDPQLARELRQDLGL